MPIYRMKDDRTLETIGGNAGASYNVVTVSSGLKMGAVTMGSNGRLVFYDDGATVIRCDATINFNYPSAHSEGVFQLGSLSYNGTAINIVYANFGACYSESVPVSYAWNTGGSAVYLHTHGSFVANKLIAWSTVLYFNRADLVTAGILT